MRLHEPLTFGHLMKRLRAERDMTQEMLATTLGCATQTIRTFELGTRRPSRALAERLASALQVPPEQRTDFVHLARASVGTLHPSPDRVGQPPPVTPEQGASAAVPLPRGTLTLVFTDIEGSTILLQALGERYADLLQAYRRIVREAVAALKGYLVDTQGDGCFIVFPRALDGVRAAIAVQRALAAHAWPQGLAVRTRIGMHTGEPRLTEDGYVGLDVHRAARIAAAGHGGQILLSGATASLVQDRLPPEVDLRDLGEHRLKDLERPERVVQLVVPELPAGFPPLRTLGVGGTSPSPEPVPLIVTKLRVPPARPRGALVPRPRLLARLDAALSTPLTLIAAPAGFGKTTLLTDWLSRGTGERGEAAQGSEVGGPAPGTHNSQLTAQNFEVAWLALDAGDSDVHQFLRYLIAALQTIAPAIGASTLTLLLAPQAPPLETLLPLLLNDLAQLPEQSILVLDDYHVIDAASVHQALVFLLDHLPPQLHLVVASRADPPLPLSRLRVRWQLTELRAHDLRFSPEEAAIFLREVMGLALSAEDVAALEARTEGWIAGLQLAALSLRDRRDAQQTAFIAAFTGSHRFVVDYLMDEVLVRQPPHLQTFLLQTSILERLCGPLCDAVLGVGGSGLGDGEPATSSPRSLTPTGGAYSQLLLEELERSNLFIVPLDDTRSWYRYHQLFAQVLRERLVSGAGEDMVSNLHRRASVWLEQQGLLPEALGHTFAAADWGRAAQLLEHHAEPMVMRGEFLTLHRWLQVLPRDVVRQRPHLLLMHAWVHVLAEFRQAGDVEAMLRDVEAVLGLNEARPVERATASPAMDHETAALRGKLAVIRAAMASNQDDVPRRVALTQEALTYLPRDNLFWRTIPTVDQGLALVAAGEVVAASRAFAEAIDLCHRAGHRYGIMIATMHLARVRAMQGQLHAAAALHQRALQLAAEQGWGQLPMVSFPHVWFGRVLFEWNDLVSATRHLLEGIKIAGLGDRQRVLLEGYAALACVAQAQGDGAGARDAMQRAEEVAQTIAAPWATRLVRAYQARLWLAQRHLDHASQWVEQAGLQTDGELVAQRELEYITLARVQIARGKPAEALPVLERLLQAAEEAGRLGSMIEILVLQALARRDGDGPARSIAVLQRALLLAAPEGYVRLFVDEGAPMAALLTRALADREWGLRPASPEQTVRAYAENLYGAESPSEARESYAARR